jgi:hypothetical protein
MEIFRQNCTSNHFNLSYHWDDFYNKFIMPFKENMNECVIINMRFDVYNVNKKLSSKLIITYKCQPFLWAFKMC